MRTPVSPLDRELPEMVLTDYGTCGPDEEYYSDEKDNNESDKENNKMLSMNFTNYPSYSYLARNVDFEDSRLNTHLIIKFN